MKDLHEVAKMGQFVPYEGTRQSMNGFIPNIQSLVNSFASLETTWEMTQTIHIAIAIIKL